MAIEKRDQVQVVSDNGYEEYTEFVGQEGVVRQVAGEITANGVIYPAAAAVVFGDGREIAFGQDQLKKQS